MDRRIFFPLTCLFISLLACASLAPQGPGSDLAFLSEEKLWRIHEDTRFTRFFYGDGGTASGLLLRWQPDSVLIQERGKDLPISIPTKGLSRIETVTGNRSMIGLAIGAVLAGGYSAIVGFETKGGISLGRGLAQFFVPPAIIVAAAAVGASIETKEAFIIPPGFQFDFEAVKRRHEK